MVKQIFPEDLERFLAREEWFFAPDNESIRTAVMAWYNGKRLKENGHISAWNTSRVTDMSILFAAQIELNYNSIFIDYSYFNEPLDAWDVSGVINMFAAPKVSINLWRLGMFQK